MSRYFWLDCVDVSGEIRIVGQDDHCAAHRDLIARGGEFLKVAGGKLVKRDPDQNPLGHDWEIHIDDNTYICAVTDARLWTDLRRMLPPFCSDNKVELKNLSQLNDTAYVGKLFR